MTKVDHHKRQEEYDFSNDTSTFGKKKSINGKNEPLRIEETMGISTHV